MSRWTPTLLALATDPKIREARYGFHPDRQGGAQYRNPQGWVWPESRYINCSTWVVQALHLGRRMLGDTTPLSFEDWKLGLLYAGEDRRGPVLMAHRWGIASEPVQGLVDLPEGQWAVCQGYGEGRDGQLGTADDTGHCFLLLRHAGGYVYLEANGRPLGGPVLGGLDGVGSRNARPRNARDWPVGNWPPYLTPDSAEAVLSRYDELWTARVA